MSDQPLSCQETFRRLNDYVDRELSPEEEVLVSAHLRVCADCASVFDFEAGVVADLMEKLNRIRMPESLKGRVAEALEQGASAAERS
jgi:predicted anti-sigma-YlaC factor YlaD